ncbi:MAG: helix-turn-helix domain-containing protein [Candidatus Latescibacteria bacterium]|nr:helix-turn-helix domain-containing protein [Candidatus Latescibacterota bacterium]
MAAKRKSTTDAVEILHKLFIEGKPEMEALLEEELANLEVAEQIRLLRSQADLSQRQLAEKTGTTASVISRLESAEYEGHSLAMLRRIAAALNKRVRISFISLKKDTKAA